MRFLLVLVSVLLFCPMARTQSQLQPRQRDAIARQERNLADLEKALAKGNATLTLIASWQNKLQGLRADLDKNAVPADAPECAALLQKVTAFEARVAEVETKVAAANWERVQKTLDEIEAAIPGFQAERDVRAARKKFEEVQKFASFRTQDPQAAAALKRIQALNDAMDAQLKGKSEQAAQVAQAGDPKNYPDLPRDSAELDQLFNTFRGFQNFRGDPQKTGAMVAQWVHAVRWVGERSQVYQPLIATGSVGSKDVAARFQRTREVLDLFKTNAQQFQQDAAPTIVKALTEAKAMAEKGAADKRPAFFTGGVRQQLDTARNWLAALSAIRGEQDEAVTTLRGRIETTQKDVDAMAATLREQILAETFPPADAYQGADRAALERTVRTAWAREHPKDQLLGVRFHMANWKRDQSSTWNSGSKSWSYSDTSVLCVTVIVKTSDTLATMYPAYLNKDHQKGDEIVPGVNTKGSAYVSTEMLLANLNAAAPSR